MEHGTTTGWEVVPALQPIEASGQEDGVAEQGGGARAGGAAGGDVPGPGGAGRGGVGPGGWGRGGGLGGRQVRGGRLWAWAGWPLVAVLVVQAVLSVRLIGADTAFQDEAAYLWAGHLEWAHWLHGVPVAPFQAY